MIHPSAVVSTEAELAPDVTVGPYAVIGAGVVAGPGTIFDAHAVVNGPTVFGRGNRVHAFASIGGDPQDKRYQGEPTRLEIGDGNVFREFCTVNRGTVQGGGLTRLGDDNLLMSYSHVAHDCELGSGVVLANCATLAGHVIVGDGAVFGGLVAVQQGVRIGTRAFLAGGAMVERDVLSYCRAAGDRARLVGINLVALKRSGLERDAIRGVKEAFRRLFRNGSTLAEATATLRESELAAQPEVAEMLAFIAGSERGLCTASADD